MAPRIAMSYPQRILLGVSLLLAILILERIVPSPRDAPRRKLDATPTVPDKAKTTIDRWPVTH